MINYVNKTTEIVEHDIGIKFLDHIFSPQTRESLRQLQDEGNQVGNRPTTRRRSRTIQNENQKERESKYVSAAMLFLQYARSFNFVFNSFGFKCPLWTKELLSYQRLKYMSDTEMLICLALLAKKHSETKRKAKPTMASLEC